MRAGPLSDQRVIRLLNAHYVPVYISNEDYAGEGSASDAEKRERLRIFREGHEAGLSVGTVHAYVLSPEGKTADSLHVATAAKTDRLLEMLQRNIARFEVPPGDPVIQPKRQSLPPATSRGELLLHVTARVITGGAWGEIPGENWVRFDDQQARGWLPSGTVAPGTVWEVKPRAAAPLLVCFYPATENNDLTKNKIEQQTLEGRVVEVRGGVARAIVRGELRMKHNFYYKEDGRAVETDLAGYLDFEPASGRIVSLRLVTDNARYNGGRFGVAAESVSPAE